MNAFRFLSLLTVGFSLLVLVFLLNATQGRMEGEATRWLEGPEFLLEPGAEAEWKLNLGGSRIEEAWPAAQRQPRVFLVPKSVEGASAALEGAEVTVDATYASEDGAAHAAFLRGSNPAGIQGREAGELAFGPIWMNWEQDLILKARVVAAPAPGTTVRLVLRGQASIDYLAARDMARTLWFVFTAIGVLGFIVLMISLKGQLAPEAKAAP